MKSQTREPTLRAVVEGLEAVEAESGERFFHGLVEHLAASLAVAYAFISELTHDGTYFRTRAVWGRGARLPDFEVPLVDTPCEAVLGGAVTHHPENLQALFPRDAGLGDWGVVSYCGVPLISRDGRVVGHLAVLDTVPMPDASLAVPVMLIFAARARAELERIGVEAALRESEATFRDLYEKAPIGYCSVDTDARIQRCNERFADLVGARAPDEIIGRSVFEFVVDSPTGRPALERSYRRFLAGETILGDELEARRVDGTTVWLRHAVVPIRDASGAVVSSRSTVEDITDLKRTETALRESEERFARVLGSALDGIVTFDDAFVIELFNRAAEKIFGCTAAVAIDGSVERFLTENFGAKISIAVEAFRRGDAARANVLAPSGLTARRADGAEFSVEATLSHVDVGGRTLHTLILRDVDELERARREVRDLAQQKSYLEEEIKAVHNFEEIVGQSPALTAALDQVGLVAATSSTVLILGETGTGKELVARAVHSASERRDRPFIKVNCAALPSGLIESELFGHERGAFTGAIERRVGRFELAHGGTIFLDEIGELPPDVQSKLLRVLQEHEFERVGGRDTIHVDVRVIAATNRDLGGMTAKESFRPDLYYRLNVFPITVPSLRERADDVPLLVHYFSSRYAAQIGKRITRVPTALMERLVAYRWPGNVRELEHMIERAVILSGGPELDVNPDALALPRASEREAEVFAAATLAPTASPVPAAAQATDGDGGEILSLVAMEREHIRAALEKSAWRIEGAGGTAALLNVNPSTLRSRMKKLGLRRNLTGP